MPCKCNPAYSQSCPACDGTHDELVDEQSLTLAAPEWEDPA